MKHYQGQKIFSHQDPKAQPDKSDDLFADKATPSEDMKQGKVDGHRFSRKQADETNFYDSLKGHDSLKADEALLAQHVFEKEDDFMPMANAETENELAIESQFEKVIQPKSRFRKWFFGGLIGFCGLITWQAVDFLMQAYQSHNWLTLGWGLFLLGLTSFGAIYVLQELWRLRRLKSQLNHQDKAMDLILANETGKGSEFCYQIAKQAHISPENIGFTRWQESVKQTHNDREVIELFDSMVVSIQDKQAQNLIANYASEAAVLVALSPLAFADMILVAWRNMTLIRRIGDVYGVKLGYWSQVRLLKLVFINMAAAGASELVVDASMHVFSMNLAGKLSTRAAQGIGVGLLTARLGIKAMNILRPLPWQQAQAVRLSSIRKQIIHQVTSRLKHTSK